MPAKKTKRKEKNPYQPRPYKVIKRVQESPDTFTLRVDMKTEHDPGQFVQVSLPGYGECPISISSDSREYLELSIHIVGTVTEALSKLKKSDTVLIRGPYGKGYPMNSLEGNHMVIVGGGCGVAPLKGVIDYVENHRDKYEEVKLFIGYRSPNDILFKKQLEDWRKKYHLTVTVDENAKGEFCYNASTGFVTNELQSAQLPTEGSIAIVCGPPVMMKIAVGILKKKGFRDEQIFISAERLMYCAVGVCCHCMIKGKYTCIDGPVFRYDELAEVKND